MSSLLLSSSSSASCVQNLPSLSFAIHVRHDLVQVGQRRQRHLDVREYDRLAGEPRLLDRRELRPPSRRSRRSPPSSPVWAVRRTRSARAYRPYPSASTRSIPRTCCPSYTSRSGPSSRLCPSERPRICSSGRHRQGARPRPRSAPATGASTTMSSNPLPPVISPIALHSPASPASDRVQKLDLDALRASGRLDAGPADNPFASCPHPCRASSWAALHHRRALNVHLTHRPRRADEPRRPAGFELAVPAGRVGIRHAFGTSSPRNRCSRSAPDRHRS